MQLTYNKPLNVQLLCFIYVIMLIFVLFSDGVMGRMHSGLQLTVEPLHEHSPHNQDLNQEPSSPPVLFLDLAISTYGAMLAIKFGICTNTDGLQHDGSVT